MNTMKRLFTSLVAIAFVVAVGCAHELPKVYILATGGTIAGTGGSAVNSQYTAGQVAISTLLDAVPSIKAVIELSLL